MAYKPDKHGRDHCPGGEDPIPCLAAGLPYCWLRQDNTQVTPLETDTSTEFIDLGPMTEGFSSDPTIMWPDVVSGHIIFNSSADGIDDGGPGSNPGLYLVGFDVANMDDWSGGGTTVVDSLKGCSVVWAALTIDGRSVVSTLKPPTGLQVEADNDVTVWSLNVIQLDTGFHHIEGWLHQYSGVQASYSQAALWAVQLASWERDTDPTFGEYFFPS